MKYYIKYRLNHHNTDAYWGPSSYSAKQFICTHKYLYKLNYARIAIRYFNFHWKKGLIKIYNEE